MRNYAGETREPGRLCGAFLAAIQLLTGATIFAQEAFVHPRARLFGDGAESVLSDLSPDETRWVILFAPRIEACTPQEVRLVQALERLQGDFPDLVVRTLLPEAFSDALVERGIFGQAFPGTLVRVSSGNWLREDRVTPRPRLEVWSGKGELLLLRSLPPTVSEEAIYDEVLWTRSFTEPPNDSRP
ncbi:MAG: hypothetical protein ACRD2Z_15710 [Thermoanaerobaculia bacterium]